MVNGCDTPPTAGTRRRPWLSLVLKTITSSEAQFIATRLPLRRVTFAAGPPRTETRFIAEFASSKNAIDSPLGKTLGNFLPPSHGWVWLRFD